MKYSYNIIVQYSVESAEYVEYIMHIVLYRVPRKVLPQVWHIKLASTRNWNAIIVSRVTATIHDQSAYFININRILHVVDWLKKPIVWTVSRLPKNEKLHKTVRFNSIDRVLGPIYHIWFQLQPAFNMRYDVSFSPIIHFFQLLNEDA